jgi:3'-phosphoadenosine 5'-phosphosulfate sulfotransferase (PAPS reductase)/FAD synthetase
MANIHHVLSLSGGKDSSALAVYLRDRIPDLKYVFCDTKKELPETYEYLDRLEVYLGKKIIRLSDDRGFDHWRKVYRDYLPSSQMRWCTKMLKIKPFERWVEEVLHNEPVLMYVGIRADEDQRKAYVSTKPSITAVYPFKDAGIDAEDVLRLLEDAGLGVPAYYEWRTRSGCYFCFFQRRAEWVGLLERHPDLFKLAKEYEGTDAETGERYTWNQRESLEELSRSARVREIKEQHQRSMEAKKRRRINLTLVEVLGEVLDDENDDDPCFFCHT